MLDEGDGAVLVAPVIDFAQELERMRLISSPYRAVETAHKTFAEQSSDAEGNDLLQALQRARVPVEKAAAIRAAHLSARMALTRYLTGHPAPPSSAPDENASQPGEEQEGQPRFPKITIPDDLPAEFSDYLDGALAWHNPAVLDKGPAREAWERILARPRAERRFKSTWAAYMLGRSWEDENPEKAVEYYQIVRMLVRDGYVDSVGLASASLGREARVRLSSRQYEEAIELYLHHLGTGDSSAALSLRVAAEEALTASPETLAQLAANPRTQRVITAFLISRSRQVLAIYRGDDDDSQMKGPAAQWLEAIERAGVRDLESAEKLALAAYQDNQMDQARRWIKRAPNSPVSEWLQAKLLLRDGKLSDAAVLLARVASAFPVEVSVTNQPIDWREGLMVPQFALEPIPGGKQVLGELGVLKLARGEYMQALDTLLSAGFWMDAAYVAERVLTLDELKQYVDAFWLPPAEIKKVPKTDDDEQESPRLPTPVLMRQQIRYLLARRLTRELRGAEARPYYPAERLASFDILARALATGWNEAMPADQRAHALFEAACMTRTNGLELIGTEVEPDWAIHAGNFEEGVSWANRVESRNNLAPASEDELSRAARHNADPELRFHYRYQAAALAWEAARLLPNNTDETAFMLWKGGCWLKNRDPETADIFYKALVRRNRKTELGAEADRRRWFPELDEDGKVVRRVAQALPETNEPVSESSIQPNTPADTMDGHDPDEDETLGELAKVLAAPDRDSQVSGEPATETTVEPASEPEPEQGYEYVVQKGDTLASIARAFSVNGVSVSMQAILEANAGLDPRRLIVGQHIFIPQAP